MTNPEQHCLLEKIDNSIGTFGSVHERMHEETSLLFTITQQVCRFA
ncbi:MAG TPA: hypothetical protein VMW77_07380 [Methanoregula sp.]|nr:hypothetical protein [Methanoregula sp.]